MIITIDGMIATGKSTIAKRLAQEIGFIYFDTGAMYRALTYGICKNKIDIHNAVALEDYLKQFQFEIKIHHGDRIYYVNGEDVTLEIRSQKVTAKVSEVSAIPAVREKLVSLQRECAEGVNAIFEGRDIGTVVFPNAQLKIFLTGNPEIRAARRFQELRAKFPQETEGLTIADVLQQINERDAYDTTRTISPLRQADDAYVIDTSTMTIDEVILKIQEYKDTLKTRLKSTLS